MRIFALIELSKVTVLPGIGRFCSKNLSANSKMQQMVLARIVWVRVIKDSISKQRNPAMRRTVSFQYADDQGLLSSLQL